MSLIELKIVVPNLENVMEHFNFIKVYRSINGVDGTYGEITAPGTRMALVESQTVYEYSDDSGDPDYYYKSSYYNSVSALESSLSEAQQGESDAALSIISVTELQDFYLFGLDLTDDAGNPYPTTLYEHFIKSAVSWLEHRLDIPVRPRSITGEKHDFYRDDYYKYAWTQVNFAPVIDVSSVQMVLPGNEVVRDFDTSWIHVQKDSGQVQIVPGAGLANTVLLGVSGFWLPYVYGAQKFIPDVFHIDYTAGFESGTVPPLIKDIVGKVASFGPLNIAGDLLGGAGIASQSISIDGLNQSFNTTSSATNAGYGARLLQYSKEIKELLPMLQRYYNGPKMIVV